MTSSLEPWCLGENGTIKSADGRVIAVCGDWRDAERILELQRGESAAIMKHEEEITSFEKDISNLEDRVREVEGEKNELQSKLNQLSDIINE